MISKIKELSIDSLLRFPFLNVLLLPISCIDEPNLLGIVHLLETIKPVKKPLNNAIKAIFVLFQKKHMRDPYEVVSELIIN